jgi:hypothetical protein
LNGSIRTRVQLSRPTMLVFSHCNALCMPRTIARRVERWPLQGEHLFQAEFLRRRDAGSSTTSLLACLLALNVLRMLRMERMSQCFVSPQLRKAGARGTSKAHKLHLHGNRPLNSSWFLVAAPNIQTSRYMSVARVRTLGASGSSWLCIDVKRHARGVVSTYMLCLISAVEYESAAPLVHL